MARPGTGAQGPGPPDTEDEEKMRAEAESPATARRDDAIRAWTQREHAIFIKYLSGDLDLQHPPNFIKEILASEHRAMVEDMHETYFNVTLTAIVPASAHKYWMRNMPERHAPRYMTTVMQDSSPDGATPMNATHEIGHEGNVTRRTGEARMAPQNTDNRFEQFQQHEAMGMFSVLADSDSEADEGVNAMQVDEAGLDQSCPLTPEQEEAPYAYPQKEDEETKDDRVHGFEEGEQAQTIVQRTGSVDDVAMTQVTDDEDGTAEHRTTPAEENAGTEEDIKPSKALEAQSATAVVRVARKAKQQLEYPAPPRIKAAAPASLTEEVVPATPDSQEKMTMGPTRTGTDAGDSDLPIQVGQWLASFDGTMVEVEANGQCALLALYASTVNHPAAKLKTTKAVVREATSFKDSFYALMMSNIRKDVALGLVDPIAEWKEDINSLKDTERSVDLTTINHLADVTEVNKLLIKRLEMRTRLDFVHARQGLAILNVDPLPSDLKDVLHIEEQHIHEAYGMDTYAASSQEDQSGGHQGSSLPQRYAKAASGDIIANTYFRILRQSNSVAKEEVDGPLEDLIALSNQEAFIKWRDLFKEELSLPKMKRRKVTSADIQEWLLAHLEALRHFFAFISFLEYEAKTRWSQDHLLQWGVMETAQPTHISTEAWHILHILSHVVCDWADTPMVGLPSVPGQHDP
ncbi:uncharacterized protein PITG_11347 [Phytophthora infestans T30-4]|uniref:Uncharacterized protein n=1 Tax=Phytophthora infestans (strain T30-4) TaxID=403677 RepID=D0NIK9_PHYIT|nr:uncharacterized protein PITG_11347 [Phytophthora infestans T30-4]EEY59343.1 conserved hypothetical protein [Phytophthora infestans T30-4]|eukprot:XP_002900953.1 conserved hypothetical protein [Phytophthora infestans T30-4]